MSQGAIVESGTYDALVAKPSGLFAELAARQSIESVK